MSDPSGNTSTLTFFDRWRPVRGRGLVRTGDPGQQHPLGPPAEQPGFRQSAGTGRVRGGAPAASAKRPAGRGMLGARVLLDDLTPEQELRGERGGGLACPRRRD